MVNLSPLENGRREVPDGIYRHDLKGYALKAYILWHIYTPGKGSLSTLHNF